MSDYRILIMDKKEGDTSFSSLYPIKKKYKGQKIGHAGTLDKFASGLMIVLVGKATKLNPVFSSMSKSYQATIKFGEETDTLDPEGNVIATSGLPTEQEIDEVLPTFLGQQKQTPPVYSAIHVDGKRAYQEARRGHEIKMPERDIEIYSLEKLSYDASKGILVLRVHVSKGTYIRSLARDIALRLNVRAHLIALRRLSIGPYNLEDVREEDSRTLLERTGLFSNLELDAEHRFEIENGRMHRSFILSDSDKNKKFKFVNFSTKLYAIGEMDEKGHLHLIFRI